MSPGGDAGSPEDVTAPGAGPVTRSAPAAPNADGAGALHPAPNETRGWSGGQASLARVTVALAAALGLGATLAGAEGWGPTGARLGMGAAAGLLCLTLALGWRTREVSVALLAFAAMAFGLPRGPSLGPLALGAALVVLALLPAAPLLSLDARGRADPRGTWRWPRVVTPCARAGFLALVAAALWWFLTGSAADPMPDAWSARAGWVLGGEAGSPLVGWSWTLAVAALGLLAFAPVNLAPLAPGRDALLLFDGDCALCHGTVRWLLAEDRAGWVQVAPLQGQTAAARLDEERRAALPDSLVLLTADGRLRTRTDAVVGLLRACGGLWRPLGAALAAVPRPLRDAGYRAVAATRKAVFGRPEAACPLLPADLGARLLG